jgi:hypothetical protein
MYKIKQILIGILIITVIGLIIVNIKYNREYPPNINNISIKTEQKKLIESCYYQSTKTDRGFYDFLWLKLNISGDEIRGEFHSLPAEKDSKVGTFEGTVGPLDQSIMARHADVWWNSVAEGMNVKEELSIIFGDGSASVATGEMIDRGDGVYIYKDKTKLTYIEGMGQIDCEYLDEKLFIEKYIRDNIKTIATNKPVLGGSWYVLSVNAVPSIHSGEATYEDGHIESKTNFTYTFDKKSQSVSITKWEIIK